MAGIVGDLFLKLYLVILVSGKLALRGWFGILETFLQILWSCTLSNSPISNFLDMYLRLKYRSNNDDDDDDDDDNVDDDDDHNRGDENNDYNFTIWALKYSDTI